VANSIRIIEQWRICFVWRDGEAWEGATHEQRDDIDARKVDFSDIASGRR
jgi:plasmid maintenance system killer protein